MQLTSMVDFVLQQAEEMNGRFELTFSYADFLKQPLTISMFVPCDEEGKPLVHPDVVEDMVNDSMTGALQVKNHKVQWDKAKETVLFEGFSLDAARSYVAIMATIETMCEAGTSATLTPAAIKQIGL